MKRVFSRIYSSEMVLNTKRRFGSATTYYVTYLHSAEGIRPLLFTSKEVDDAAKRAESNKEDVAPPNRSWLRESWYRLIRLLK